MGLQVVGSDTLNASFLPRRGIALSDGNRLFFQLEVSSSSSCPKSYSVSFAKAGHEVLS